MFIEKWEQLSDKTKMIIQITLGVVFAVGAGFFLSRPRPENSGFLDINTLLAIGLALIGPNICEAQTASKMPILRRTMLIVLAVLIVGYIIYGLIAGKF